MVPPPQFSETPISTHEPESMKAPTHCKPGLRSGPPHACPGSSFWGFRVQGLFLRGSPPKLKPFTVFLARCCFAVFGVIVVVAVLSLGCHAHPHDHSCHLRCLTYEVLAQHLLLDFFPAVPSQVSKLWREVAHSKAASSQEWVWVRKSFYLTPPPSTLPGLYW